MNLESQVCSLEYAKRLLELGIKQNSLFYWADGSIVISTELDLLLDNGKVRSTSFVNNSWPDQDILCISSAFNASELGEILPNVITTKEQEPFNNYRICITKFYSVNKHENYEERLINNYIVNYECDSTEIHGENAWLRRRLTNNIYDPNLANAMAKMLIYLIENKLMEIPK
jgi:hypothetical protein